MALADPGEESPFDPREERAAWWVAAGASVFFAAIAAWELFGPIHNGHTAANAGMGIIADNMLRWGIAGPVWEYTREAPSPKLYYCHHPWGSFWTTAFAMRLFGRHDLVCRLPAALLSAATPPLLFAIGRRLYRPAAGAAAALAFATLPIALSFSQLNTLEVPVTAWSLLGLHGYLRFRESARARDGALSLAGFALALHADWPAFVLVALVLVLFGAHAFVFPRVLRGGGGTPARAAGAYWAALATLAVLTGLFYAALFVLFEKLPELVGSAKMRSAGSDQPLGVVLAARRHWLELMFTKVGLALAAVSVLVVGARALVRRDEREALPLAWLAMAAFQYVVFKQGADIHVFWPHYFATWIALGLAALVASVAWALERPGLAVRLPRLGPRAGVVALALGALVCLPLLRDALPALAWARRTGGRFSEKGVAIDSDGAKTAFLSWLDASGSGARLRGDQPLQLTSSLRPTWGQVWALGGRVVTLGRFNRNLGAAAFDLRDMTGGDIEEAARAGRVSAVGSYWLVDPSAPPSLDGYRFVEREPTVWERLFSCATEPVRRVEPDAFATWEALVHFRPGALAGFDGAALDAPGEDAEHLRVAHNVHVHERRTAEAAALAARLAGGYGPPTASFRDGTELLGVLVTEGVSPELWLLLRAGAASGRSDVRVAVSSRVVEPMPLSATMADPVVRDVGFPTFPTVERWREGFLYRHRVPLLRRPGREVFEVALATKGGRPIEREGGKGGLVVLDAR